MSTVEDCLSGAEQLSVWTYLFVISVTGNVFFVLYLSALATIRLFQTRKRRKDVSNRKLCHTAAGSEDFVYRNRHKLALCLADAIVYVLVFSGAIYLLIEVAIANAFTLKDSRLLAVTTVVFSVHLGRVGLAIFVSGFLINDGVEHFSRQLTEQALTAVLHLALIRSGDALLTRALLCVMVADGQVASLCQVAEVWCQPAGRALARRLKAVRAFVALAFRGLTPLVCLLVSLLAFDNGDFLEMSYAAIVMASGCGVVFPVYNTYVIVTSLRHVWNAYAVRYSRAGQLDGHGRVDAGSGSTKSKVNNKLDTKGSTVPNNLVLNELDTKHLIRNPRTDLNMVTTPIVNKLWLNFQPTGKGYSSGITRHKHKLNIRSKININKLNIPRTIEEETESVINASVDTNTECEC